MVNTANIPEKVIERAENSVPDTESIPTRKSKLVTLREAEGDEIPADATKYDKVYYYEIEDFDASRGDDLTYYGVIYYHSRMGEASKRQMGIEK